MIPTIHRPEHTHTRIRNHVYVSAIVLSCCLFAACTRTEEVADVTATQATVAGDTVTITKAQRDRIRLHTEPIVVRDMSVDLRVNGRIDVPPQYAARIVAPMGGVVRSVSILPGSRVSRGQTLFTLEHQDFVTLQRDYLTTLARLEVAEGELRRQEDLAKDQINAGKIVEQMTGDVRALRIARKSLQEQLALLNINAKTLTENTITRTVRVPAPITGYVTGLYVMNGSYSPPNDSLADIASTDYLQIELFVYERDASLVREGQSFTATVNSGTKRTFAGRIQLVGRGVGTDRTVVVHGLPNVKDATLLPGTTISAIVHTDPHKAVVVPSSAVVQDDTGAWIFLETEDNQYVRRKVSVGSEDNGIIELLDVTQSLAGQRIVSRGAIMLHGAFVSGDE